MPCASIKRAARRGEDLARRARAVSGPPTSTTSLQVRALEQLHRVVEDALGGPAEVVDRDGVGVAEAGGQADLAFEPLEVLFAAAARGQQLDGGRSAHERVAGPVHDAHAALAELGQQAVLTELAGLADLLAQLADEAAELALLGELDLDLGGLLDDERLALVDLQQAELEREFEAPGRERGGVEAALDDAGVEVGAQGLAEDPQVAVAGRVVAEERERGRELAAQLVGAAGLEVAAQGDEQGGDRGQDARGAAGAEHAGGAGAQTRRNVVGDRGAVGLEQVGERSGHGGLTRRRGACSRGRRCRCSRRGRARAGRWRRTCGSSPG
jgi:hypothetical protein